MTTDNALDPPPFRRRTGRAPFPRLAATIAGVVVAVAAVAVIAHFVLQHPSAQGAGGREGFNRASASSSTQVQPPPAVTQAQAQQSQANLDALQRAADAPGLAASAHRTQVATVSPLAGRAPSGAGVTPSSNSVGPADG